MVTFVSTRKTSTKSAVRKIGTFSLWFSPCYFTNIELCKYKNIQFTKLLHTMFYIYKYNTYICYDVLI